MSALSVAEAAARVRSGGLVAYPTETVWGLGADAASECAVERLRRFKGRDAARPISILVESAAALESLGFRVSPQARALVAAFWPGPLSLVLPCRRRFARGIAREDGAVGVRCSSHPVAAALAERLAREGLGPLTATSLNKSGEAPACSAPAAHAFCDAGPDAPRVVEAGDVSGGDDAPSTVIDLCGEAPIVVRWGALPREQVQSVLDTSHAP